MKTGVKGTERESAREREREENVQESERKEKERLRVDGDGFSLCAGLGATGWLEQPKSIVAIVLVRGRV